MEENIFLPNNPYLAGMELGIKPLKTISNNETLTIGNTKVIENCPLCKKIAA